MMKTISRAIFACAAISLASLPIAAQANTRAGDSGAFYNVSAPGLGRSSEGESFGGATAFIIALLSASLIIGGIVIASDTDGQSPGV